VGPRELRLAHGLHTHTSILRLIESKWNLPALSDRDANAAPMLDCFDFVRPAFLTPPSLPPAPAPTGVLACAAATPAG
jgi:phospholipase C